jgi:hypothetical protein
MVSINNLSLVKLGDCGLRRLPSEDIYHILSYLGPESIYNCLKAHQLFHVLSEKEKYINQCMHKGIFNSIKDGSITVEAMEYIYYDLLKNTNKCIYISTSTNYKNIIADNFIKYLKWYYGYDTVINIYDEIYELISDNDTHKYMTKNNIQHIMRQFNIEENTIINAKSVINLAFVISCKYGRFEIAKMLYELDKDSGMIDIHVCEDIAFIWSCLNGHEAIANWLYIESIKNGKRIDTSTNYSIVFNMPYTVDNILFTECCKRSTPEVCIWLLYINIEKGTPINIHMRCEEAFVNSCKYGNLYVADLLYTIGKCSLSPINIHINNDKPFIVACQNGHLNIAKWLYDISIEGDGVLPIDIQVGNDEAYKCSYMYGYEDLKEWVIYKYADRGIDITENKGYNWYLGMQQYGNIIYNYGSTLYEYLKD